VVWHKVQALTSKTIEERTAWLADYYTKGNNAYKLDLVGAKAAIDELNKQIYKFHEDNDHASAIAQIYWTCRDWSYSYFDKFYDLVGIHFEKFYPEAKPSTLASKKSANISATSLRKATGRLFLPVRTTGCIPGCLSPARDYRLTRQKMSACCLKNGMIITLPARSS